MSGEGLNPFDRALELQALADAADAYASRYGDRGSDSYHTAWLKFRHRVQSLADLRRLQKSRAGRMRAARTRVPLNPSQTRSPFAEEGTG